MRQAGWNELFAGRHEPLDTMPDLPDEPTGWWRLLWWEDLLTFGLLGVLLLTVVGSVDRAGWVDEMPSLYPIAFFGLLLGALLARLRWPEGVVHLVALPVGAAAALGTILTVVPGPAPWDRYDALHARMAAWFDAAFTGGISNDGLPFVVLVVPLTWLTAYLSAWAVFRWRNVWAALVPGGTVLLLNIGSRSQDSSLAFIVFLIGAALLVTRLHLVERTRAWRDERTPYPAFLSLSVLHASCWAGLLLVGLAWLMPRADEAEGVESLWRQATAPVTERFEGMGRLFVGVDAGEGGSERIHGFEEFLPFEGSLDLPEDFELDVTTEPLDQPRYLRAQVYDIYSATGWRRSATMSDALSADEQTGVEAGLDARIPITAQFAPNRYTGDHVLTIGQPRRVGADAEVHWNEAFGDIVGVTSEELRPGRRYETVGDVSVATEEQLRAAPSESLGYPSWIRRADYWSLPDDFPISVRTLALELTNGEPTAYDKAVAIESYLRQIPFSLEAPDTPVGRDAVQYFLFESQQGFFDHHASAMVVMLRSVGIPSRLAGGFVLQESERDPGSSHYVVTEESAFVWPEVYFPGLGWVEFNPTPSQPTISRGLPSVPDTIPIEMEDGPATTGLGLEALPDQFPDGTAEEPEPFAAEGGGASVPWTPIGVAGGFAVAIAGGAVALHYAWRRGLAGLDAPSRLWGQTVRLASWARLPPEPSQTPAEYARALSKNLAGLVGVDLLADAYVRRRYGGERPSSAEQFRLEETWRAVRSRLLKRLFRLA